MLQDQLSESPEQGGNGHIGLHNSWSHSQTKKRGGLGMRHVPSHPGNSYVIESEVAEEKWLVGYLGIVDYVSKNRQRNFCPYTCFVLIKEGML